MNVKDVLGLFALPFPELVYQAASVHRQHFDPAAVQLSTLLSSRPAAVPRIAPIARRRARYLTGVEDEDVLSVDDRARRGAHARRKTARRRFCMGAAWRGPKDRDLDKILPMVEGVKALGTRDLRDPRHAQARPGRAACATRGSTTTTTTSTPRPSSTARSSARAPRTTGSRRSSACAAPGINVCCGGIVGMGESRRDRAALIAQLSSLDPYPEACRSTTWCRSRARRSTARRTARSLRVRAHHRRARASPCRRRWCGCRRDAGDAEAVQALCFLAGANSMFYGEKLLTTGNPEAVRDRGAVRAAGP